MPKLDLPKLEYISSYVEALREGFRRGIAPVTPEDKIREIENDPRAFLDDFLAVKTGPVKQTDGTFLPRVPSTRFWLVDGNVFIGETSIRHHLNEHLMVMGGHIGYGVRPSMQNKGHATEILRQSLDFCRKELKLDKVLMTVDDENAPSIKVIEKNGGILENKVPRPDGGIGRRYWITL